MLPKEMYIENRRRLAESMKDHSICLIHSGLEKEYSHDECYLFEPYRNFLYLTGYDRPGSILLIEKHADGKTGETLFVPVPTALEQRWSGIKFNGAEIRDRSGIARIADINTFDNYISRLMSNGVIQDVYIDLEKRRVTSAPNGIEQTLEKLRSAYPYITVHNVFATVAKMRTIKCEAEIEAHRKAVEITELGVRNMLRNMKPGMYEYEIEAYYDFVLKSHGVKAPAFHTIAAAGQNANYMHYSANNTKTEDGQMILFDLGARYEYYCADVSRTYPINGKFTERQKQLYTVVLNGLKAAEAAAKPGVVKDELQLISRRVMAEELVKIGKIEKTEDISKYYMHGSGHNIGLDTHDPGDINLILEKDLMFTLEPGLYFDDEQIGIRIEDTLLVTEDGVDILSASIPKEIEDIEAYMAGK